MLHSDITNSSVIELFMAGSSHKPHQTTLKMTLVINQKTLYFMKGHTLLSWLYALLLIFHPKIDGSVVENFVVGQY